MIEYIIKETDNIENKLSSIVNYDDATRILVQGKYSLFEKIISDFKSMKYSKDLSSLVEYDYSPLNIANNNLIDVKFCNQSLNLAYVNEKVLKIIQDPKPINSNAAISNGFSNLNYINPNCFYPDGTFQIVLKNDGIVTNSLKNIVFSISGPNINYSITVPNISGNGYNNFNTYSVNTFGKVSTKYINGNTLSEKLLNENYNGQSQLVFCTYCDNDTLSIKLPKILDYDSTYNINISLTYNIEGSGSRTNNLVGQIKTRKKEKISNIIYVNNNNYSIDDSSFTRQNKNTQFASLQGALNAIMEFNATKDDEFTINLARNEKINKSMPYRELIRCNTPARVIINGNDNVIEFCNTGVLNRNSEQDRAVFEWSGGDLILNNLTIKNSYSRSFFRLYETDSNGNYVINDNGNRVEVSSAGEAFGMSGSGNLIAYNCKFYGKQDTIRLKNKAWLYNCYIEGDTDFIWGELGLDTALLENCNIKYIYDPEKISTKANGTTSINSSGVMLCPKQNIAPLVGKGLVLWKCNIEIVSGTRVYLGRNPWGYGTGYENTCYNNATIIDCKITSPNSGNSINYVNNSFLRKTLWENDGNSPCSAIGFKDYNNTINGKLITNSDLNYYDVTNVQENFPLITDTSISVGTDTSYKYVTTYTVDDFTIYIRYTIKKASSNTCTSDSSLKYFQFAWRLEDILVVDGRPYDSSLQYEAVNHIGDTYSSGSTYEKVYSSRRGKIKIDLYYPNGAFTTRDHAAYDSQFGLKTTIGGKLWQSIILDAPSNYSTTDKYYGYTYKKFGWYMCNNYNYYNAGTHQTTYTGSAQNNTEFSVLCSGYYLKENALSMFTLKNGKFYPKLPDSSAVFKAYYNGIKKEISHIEVDIHYNIHIYFKDSSYVYKSAYTTFQIFVTNCIYSVSSNGSVDFPNVSYSDVWVRCKKDSVTDANNAYYKADKVMCKITGWECSNYPINGYVISNLKSLGSGNGFNYSAKTHVYSSNSIGTTQVAITKPEVEWDFGWYENSNDWSETELRNVSSSFFESYLSTTTSSSTSLTPYNEESDGFSKVNVGNTLYRNLVKKQNSIRALSREELKLAIISYYSKFASNSNGSYGTDRFRKYYYNSSSLLVQAGSSGSYTNDITTSLLTNNDTIFNNFINAVCSISNTSSYIYKDNILSELCDCYKSGTIYYAYNNIKQLCINGLNELTRSYHKYSYSEEVVGRDESGTRELYTTELPHYNGRYTILNGKINSLNNSYVADPWIWTLYKDYEKRAGASTDTSSLPSSISGMSIWDFSKMDPVTYECSYSYGGIAFGHEIDNLTSNGGESKNLSGLITKFSIYNGMAQINANSYIRCGYSGYKMIFNFYPLETNSASIGYDLNDSSYERDIDGFSSIEIDCDKMTYTVPWYAAEWRNNERYDFTINNCLHIKSNCYLLSIYLIKK